MRLIEQHRRGRVSVNPTAGQLSVRQSLTLSTRDLESMDVVPHELSRVANRQTKILVSSVAVTPRILVAIVAAALHESF